MWLVQIACVARMSSSAKFTPFRETMEISITVFHVGYWVCEKKQNRRWPLLTKEQESLPCVVRKSHYSGGSSRVDSVGWPIAGYKNIALFGQNGKPLNVSQIIANNRQAFGKVWIFALENFHIGILKKLTERVATKLRNNIHKNQIK